MNIKSLGLLLGSAIIAVGGVIYLGAKAITDTHLHVAKVREDLRLAQIFMETDRELIKFQHEMIKDLEKENEKLKTNSKEE